MSVLSLPVEIDGVVRTVQVRRDGPHFSVLFDGHEHRVDAVLIEPGRWSLLIGRAPASREVRVRNDRRGGWTVLIQGAAAPIRVGDARRRHGSASPSSLHVGPVHITAPMPGKVVRLLVGQGDAVDARQGVVVVEAMKMENELVAPAAGRVASIEVRSGQPVEKGAVLIILE